MEICRACYREKVVCERCRKVVCPNCEVVELIDTPVAKGWFCVTCFGGPTELHEKLLQFSREHGSPNVLLLKYKHTQTKLG